MNIDFEENHFALRPNLKFTKKVELENYCFKNNIRKSLLIASSGTTYKNQETVFIIKHSCMLSHARLISKLFNYNEKSRILNVLPVFFMGGTSNIYRAKVSGAKLIHSNKWSSDIFKELVFENQITHCSLVPTQLYDLIKNNVKLPSSLKYLFVGGAALSEKLKTLSLENGYPVYETYGQTEFCSQVATNKIQKNKSNIDVLPGIAVTALNKILKIKSPYHFYEKLLISKDKIEVKQYCDFTDENNYFVTSDLASISHKSIKILGRSDHLRKINGKFVNLADLERRIQEDLNLDSFYLTTQDNERNGLSLVLVSTHSINCGHYEILKNYHIKKIMRILSFEKTMSGKLVNQRYEEMREENIISEIVI